MDEENIDKKDDGPEPILSQNSDISVRLEKVASLAQANREFSKVYSEKIDRLNTMLGELRSMQLRHEQELGKLGAEFEVTKDMVKSVEPAKFSLSIAKVEEKQSMLTEKMKILEKISSQSIEEFKNLRHEFQHSKELREIIKLGKDVRNDTRELKTLQVQIERDLHKTENINSQILKKYDEFITYTNTAHKIEQLYKKITPEIDQIKEDLPNFVHKNHLQEIKDSIVEFENGIHEKIDVKLDTIDSSIEKAQTSILNLEKEKIGFVVFCTKTKQELSLARNMVKEEVTRNIKGNAAKIAKMEQELSKQRSSFSAELKGIRSGLEKRNHEFMNFSNSTNKIHEFYISLVYRLEKIEKGLGDKAQKDEIRKLIKESDLLKNSLNKIVKDTTSKNLHSVKDSSAEIKEMNAQYKRMNDQISKMSKDFSNQINLLKKEIGDRKKSTQKAKSEVAGKKAKK